MKSDEGREEDEMGDVNIATKVRPHVSAYF
jgi:hypothetical protein